MEQYKNTGVYYAKDSQLGKALADKKPEEASKIFKQTTAGFERDVPNAEDRMWLIMRSKGLDMNKCLTLNGAGMDEKEKA